MRVLAALALLTVHASGLTPQATPSHIRTRWASQVSTASPLPEYPRPQLVRRAWTNLNGQWDYAITRRGAPTPTQWDGKILVPFPVESQLSGVERVVTDAQQLWYHRTFSVPATSRNRRQLLHFGAVDWEATVYVNGMKVGEHRGGYDPFTIDITSAMRGSDQQELVVSVWDPTEAGPQPRGKQVLKPGSIWYNAVTGIWQTVWLEPVVTAHVTDLSATPDIDAGTVTLDYAFVGAVFPADARSHVTIMAEGKVVVDGEGTLAWTHPVVLKIPQPHLWSPDDPFLYDVRLTLPGGDTVAGYFGMRKIAVAHDSSGVNRLFLNNKPLFQYGTLDQGWWPDGLYTAPTDEALRFDIEATKRLGFNMIRKHVKVEPARWYYHADKIGMLVWQDMPSGDNNTMAGMKEFEDELHHMVDALRMFPSIVMWVPFNEGWGQHDTERHVAWLKSYDPSRLVNNASGWTDKHVGDVSDIHAYPGPGMPSLEPNRAAVLGEFGGLGLPLAGHTWLDTRNWGYKTYTSTETLGTAYRDLLTQLRYLIVDGLSAAVYTQTTDVEIEVNGLMTYDRAVTKLPADAIAAAAPLWGSLPRVTTIVPTSQRAGQMWRYTTTPPAADWFTAAFNDGAWPQGSGGFGTEGTPGSVVRTVWTTADIWLRRTFTLASNQLIDPQWRIHHDEDADLYLNGELVAKLNGYTAEYVRIPFDAKAKALLKIGVNTLAVHVHQTTGGQYIDVGIDDRITP